MAEQAADYCKLESEFEIIGGFFSPVGDAYKKVGLASAYHRISMCNLAVSSSSSWVAVDPWEALHKEYLVCYLPDVVDVKANIGTANSPGSRSL